MKLAFVAFLFCAATLLGAQTDLPRTDTPVTDGYVSAVREANGNVYLGGNFDYVGSQTGAAARINASTAVVDAAFPVVNGDVFAVEPDGSGGWFLGGSFTSVGGVARAGLVRIDASNNVVAAFQADVDGVVLALELSGTTLYAGGFFRTVGSSSRQHLAAVDAATGAVAGFAPQPDDRVFSISAANGNIYFAGRFENVGSSPRAHAASVNASGALQGWDPGFNDDVLTLLATTTSVYVGGEFFASGGGTTPHAQKSRGRFAVVDTATGADTGELDNVQFYRSVTDLEIDSGALYVGHEDELVRINLTRVALLDGNGIPRTISAAPDDHVYVTIPDGTGGWFIAGEFASVDSTARPFVARLDAVGALDTTFNPNLSGVNYTRINALAISGASLFIGGEVSSGNCDVLELSTTTGAVQTGLDIYVTQGGVNALHVQSGELFVGGDFNYLYTTPAGTLAREGVGSINITSGAITSTLTGLNTTGVAHAITSDATNVYVGGLFIQVNGVFRNHLAAVALATGTVASWNPNPNSEVRALATDGSVLYAGGDFLQLGATPRTRLAAFNSSTLSLLSFAAAANNEVRGVTLDGGFLYVAGDFTNIAGTPRARLARIDATTAAVDLWDPMESATAINSVAAVGGQICAVGSLGQVSAPRSGGCAFDLATEQLQSFNPNIPQYTVEDLAIAAGVVYATGGFLEVNGMQRFRIAAFDTAGQLLSFSPLLGGTGHALQAGAGEVLVGGSFRSAGGLARNNLVAIDATTRQVTSWSPVDAPVVQDILVDAGVVYVAGQQCASFDVSTAAAGVWAPVVDNSVRSLAKSGSTIYLGGSFDYVARYDRDYFAVTDPATGDADPAFPSAPARARALAPDGSGGYYVGGDNYLLHYLSNGSLDTSFNVTIESGRIVESMALGGGKLWFSGTFEEVNGAPRNHFAAVNPTTGVLDAWDPNANTGVETLRIFGNRLYAVGNLSSIGASARDDVASFDLSTGALTSWAPTFNGSVRGIAWDGTWLYLGGGFTTVSGMNRTRICQISPTSNTPSTWVMDAPDDFVWALEANGTTLHVGGEFQNVGSQPRTYLCAFDTSAQSLLGWAPSANGTISRFALDGSDLYMMGGFSTLQGQPRQGLGSLVAATGALNGWDPKIAPAPLYDIVADGSSVAIAGNFVNGVGGVSRTSLAATDAASSALLSFNVDVNDYVDSLAISSGRLFFGGNFDQVNSTTRNGIASVSLPSGTLESFDPDIKGRVRGIMLQGGTLHVAGGFLTVGGMPHSNFVSVDINTGNPVGGSTGVDSIAVTVWNDNGTLYVGGGFESAGLSRSGAALTNSTTGAISATFPLIDGHVRAAVADGAGGWYLAIHDGQGGYSVRRVLSTGTFDANFNVVLNNYVYDMVLDGTTLYLGGAFTTVGTTSRVRLAAIDADSASTDYGVPLPFNGSANGTVYALALDGTNLYVGGTFTQLGSSTRYGLGGYDLTTGNRLLFGGTAATSLSNGGDVYDLQVSGSTLYVAGEYTTAGGSARTNLAAWDLVGSQWLTWAPFVDDRVEAIWLDGLTAYVGGWFSMIETTPRNYVGAINADPSSGSYGQPTTWAPILDGTVRHMQVAGTDVLVAGEFNNVGTTYFGGAAVLDTATGLPTSWSQSFGGHGYMHLPSASGYLVVGQFDIVEALPVDKLISMDASSGMLTPWRPVVEGAGPGSIYVQGTAIYVGGQFSSISGVPVSQFAEFETRPNIVTHPTLPDVYEGLAYSGQFIAAAGGVAPYGWQISNGPGWLSVNPTTGELTGTVPMIAPTNVTFDITVTDQNSDTDIQAFNFDVVVVTPVQITTSSPLSDQYETFAITGVTFQTQGGAPAFTWSLQNAPAWLSINSSTGELQGTPPAGSAPTTVNFDVVVDDQASQQDVEPFSFDLLVYANPQITTSSLQDAFEGTFYSGVFVQATDGAPPYTWSMSGGPAWLSIDSATGELMGNVPGGTAPSTVNFTVDVVDSFSNSDQAALQFDIIPIPQPVVTTTALPTATQLSAWQANVAATGGAAPYSWAITDGPTWIQINSVTGELTGVPPVGQLGTFELTVEVSDSFTPVQTAAATLSFVLLEAPCVSPGTEGWESKPNFNSGTGSPGARFDFASVWTGTRFIVWGGSNGSSLNDGGIYNPATDLWESAPNLNTGIGAPSSRHMPQAVWTGEYMIVWGGNDGGTSYADTGGIYDPVSDSWVSAPNLENGVGAPQARIKHTLLWTGRYLLVWGGRRSGGGATRLNTGGLYDPATDTWLSVPNLNSGSSAPSGRTYHSAVWTGTQLVVWGGQTGGTQAASTGGIYDLATDTWSLPAGLNSFSLQGRGLHTTAWSGTKMVVWGGQQGGQQPSLRDGGAYDVATDTWSYPTNMNTDPGRPSGREELFAVWGCGRLIIWSGKPEQGQTIYDDGGVYELATDSWLNAPNLENAVNAPAGRRFYASVWANDRMLIFGGTITGVLDDGGSYIPPDYVVPTPPTVTVVALDATAAEATPAIQTGTYRVTFGPATTGTLTLNYTLTGTANSGPGSDYDLAATGLTHSGSGGSIVVNAGVSTIDVLLTPVDDALLEGLETAVFTVTSGAGYGVGTPDTAVVQISDNDGTGVPDVSITASGDVAEDGLGVVTFQVVASSVPASDITVIIDVSGTATHPGDFTLTGLTLTGGTGTVILPSGVGSAMFTLTPVDDSDDEGDEDVIASILVGSSYNVGTPSMASASILDDDGSSGGGGSGDSGDDEDCSSSEDSSLGLGAILLLLASLGLARRMRALETKKRPVKRPGAGDW